jgi:asparagine synthase (glutamine-hydrolysing)
VFNGEIYNFAELRADLSKVGHTFASTGDSEVLLRGLQHEGERFIERLNGIFAFALWDRQERELLLARDPLGVKPLYWAEPEPGTLLFASELKALCAHPGLRREPDFEIVLQHLAFCHACGDRTALRGVRRLPPGSVLRWSARSRTGSLRSYWRPRFQRSPRSQTPFGNSRAFAALELQELVRTATHRQLVSDVPVGSFLSGGLDSSLIREFQCYTITFPASENILDGADDDAQHARVVAGRLELRLREIELRPEVATLWPRLVYHLDEPLADPAAISCYLISRLARENGTTVLLSGQGADELFCGYPRYRAMSATACLARAPRLVRRVLSRGARFLPGSREGWLGTALRRLRRVGSSLDLDPDERFLSYCASSPEDEITRVLSPGFSAALGGRRFHDSCLAYLRQRQLSGLKRHEERDLSVYLPNHNLLYTDKMGMAVGLEARVPFLDPDVVEAANSYPAGWKLARGTTKAILRTAARGIVPETVLSRPKAGFGAPFRKWLRYDLAEMWDDLLNETAVNNRGWFRPDLLQEARRRSQAGQVDLYMLQWAVLTVELWARRFLDRNPLTA